MNTVLNQEIECKETIENSQKWILLSLVGDVFAQRRPLCSPCAVCWSNKAVVSPAIDGATREKQFNLLNWIAIYVEWGPTGGPPSGLGGRSMDTGRCLERERESRSQWNLNWSQGALPPPKTIGCCSISLSLSHFLIDNSTSHVFVALFCPFQPFKRSTFCQFLSSDIFLSQHGIFRF